MKDETENKIKKEKRKDYRILLLQYGISFLACSLLTFIWAWASGIFNSYQSTFANGSWNMANEAQKNYFLLTNAFFGSGVIFAGVGLLVVASNQGAFTMLYYGLRRFISIFQRDPNKFRFHTYYDYVTYRDGKPKSSYAFLLVVGSVFVGISFIFLALYYGAA